MYFNGSKEDVEEEDEKNIEYENLLILFNRPVNLAWQKL